MRILAAILFSLLIIIGSIPSIGTFIQFKYNQGKIAQTQCVQRKSDVNMCQGKCQLRKELSELNDQSESPLIDYNENTLNLFLIADNILPTTKHLVFLLKKESISNTLYNPRDFILKLLKPPQ